MRKFTLLAFLFISFSMFAQKGFVNPAAKYAEMLGYDFQISKVRGAGEEGLVKLPDGTTVNAWDFFKGKVAQDYSYGARYGYETETETVTENGYTTERAVCIRVVRGNQERIPLLDLMEMNGDPLITKENRTLSETHNDAKVDPNFTVSRSLPASFDWRNKDGHAYIGTPRNQGTCGACYSFGAAAAAEGAYNLTTGSVDGNTADFSEAYIAWCLSKMSAYSSHFSGCNGADYDYMELQALVDVGIVDDQYFPYTITATQNCPAAATNAPKTKFASWNRVPCSDVAAIKTAIMTYGVVDAAVYVSTAFQNYSGGVYSDASTSCSANPCYNTTTNHAISLVGWGNDPVKGDYWILRNSWGSTWGEGGYMRLAATSARIACSVCYMTYASTDTQAPTAPANLTSSNITNNSVLLSWSASTDNVGVTGYDVYRNGSLLTTTSNNSFNVTGLSVATAYSFYVKAKDAAGNVSSASSTINVTTTGTVDTQAPTAPTNLSSSNVTATSVSLSWTASTDNVGVTGYDIYRNGSKLTSVTATSYNVTGLAASTAYSFYVKAKDAAGNISVASSTINVTTDVIVASYCESKGNDYSYEWISSVKIGSFVNTSAGNGYSDFTNKVINLTKGEAVNVELIPAFKSTAYNEYWKIWVDLNGDKDFDDAGELVFDAGSLSKTTVTGSLTIPTGATATTTRMRVSMKYNAAQTVCEAFGYGEVEDYTVNLSTAIVDTQAPTVPAGLVATNVTTSSATISWNGSTDNVAVTGYDVYKDGSLLGTTATTSYNVTGLVKTTTYAFTVKAKDAAGNISAASNALNVTTLTPQLDYCASNGKNSSYEWIDLVQLAEINNATGDDSGYKDYTAQTATIAIGSTERVTVSCGFKSSTYTEFWNVWIDYNQDGVFADSEKVMTGSSSSSANLYNDFNVPTDAALGNTRMRVSMKYNADGTSCESFSYGEVEDYTVNIVATKNTGAGNNYSNDAIALGFEAPSKIASVYPNPTNGLVSITLNGDVTAPIRVYSQVGQLVKTIMPNNRTINIDLTEYSNGVYTIKIPTEKGSEAYKVVKL
ncbi:MAG: fibronectin type III domain-containing protein [Bacteroidales bacterium]|nr:fibronectin type III domain-containing protein [Bacteroidales bacterium]